MGPRAIAASGRSVFRRSVSIREYDHSDTDFAGLVAIWEAQWRHPVQRRIWATQYPQGWNVHEGIRLFRPHLRLDPSYKDQLFLVAEVDRALPYEETMIVACITGSSLDSMIANELEHLRERFANAPSLGNIDRIYYQRDLFASSARVLDTETGLRPLRLLHQIFCNRASDLSYDQLVARTPHFNKLGIRAFVDGLGFRDLFGDDNPHRRYFQRSTVRS